MVSSVTILGSDAQGSGETFGQTSEVFKTSEVLVYEHFIYHYPMHDYPILLGILIRNRGTTNATTPTPFPSAVPPTGIAQPLGFPNPWVTTTPASNQLSYPRRVAVAGRGWGCHGAR
jgi:hypothetical protein